MTLPEPQRESARAAEQVGDPLRAREGLAASVGHHFLAGCRRLQKTAGGQNDARVPEATCGARRSTSVAPWFESARKVNCSAAAASLRSLRRLQRPGAAEVDIEPRQRRGRLDVERLAEPSQLLRRASAPTAGAACNSGANSGQASISTISCERARA